MREICEINEIFLGKVMNIGQNALKVPQIALLPFTDGFLEISEYASYLHFGRGFSYLYGGWAEIIVTVCILYDSQRNAFY